MKTLLPFILALFSLASCKDDPFESDDKNGDKLPLNFTISGKISGAEGQKLYVESPSEKGPIPILSTTVGNDGSFKVSGNIAGLGLYFLRLGNNPENSIPISPAPGDHLKVNARVNSFSENPNLSGTKWSTMINQYLPLLANFRKQQQVLMGNQRMLTEEEFAERITEYKKPITNFVIEQIRIDPASPAHIILTMEFFPMLGFEGWNPSFLEPFKEVVVAFSNTYGDVPASKTLYTQYNQLEEGYQQFKLIEEGEIEAPDFALLDPSGKKIKLSDFKGNLVLIDFWASWCAPCRKESPNVVKIYQEHKKRNFTILSVSLDEDPVQWKKAIQEDGLVWKTHVSDLKGWKSGLPQLYGFDGIPHTVLVNPDGKIIAQGLRGEALNKKINAFYKK